MIGAETWQRWTAEDDRLLREMYARKESREAMALALGRTENAIHARAGHLGIRKRISSRGLPRTPKAPKNEAGRTKMACICCGHDFYSEDRVRNRLCRGCKERDNYMPSCAVVGAR